MQLKAADGQQLMAYQAEPQGELQGGLVVVQEIFGVNSYVRGVADSYAAQGYSVIAPALFDRYEPGVELSYTQQDRPKAFELYGKLKPETALLDVGAAFQHVSGMGAGIGVVGFCYGGLMAWLSATRGPALGFQPACVVGYYAGGIGTFAGEQPSCPVMLHFGEDDSHIGKDQIDAVRQAHPEVQIYTYNGAGHAFDRSPDPQAFKAEASALARQRTSAFLQKHIR